MFAFNRSAFAVLAPLALLAGVVLWSNQDPRPIAGAASQQAQVREEDEGLDRNQTVAANLPSR